ncbi:hypothetical protein D1B31_16235 [Neobacillus notoginsengisoli]|uniref:Uncharacterized protein n=1 Tax=Neobacillus notoginsengisoli TaxID=1578198 RepID=A0A417YRP9_9BACI|nr:hypothetical protein [Neobacillus notoginsengisoli]RHW37313.1 hypothetical protein D1B31_16235 [Neobacillus notoginsengisoli]
MNFGGPGSTEISSKVLDSILARLKEKLDVSLSGSKAVQAKVLTVGQEVAATNGITTNTDVVAEVLFANDSTSVSVKLIAGVVYPYSVKKVVSGSGIVGLY